MPKHNHLLSPENIANPYPLYAQLRKDSPVYLDPYLGCWVITRYADVLSAFANPHLSSERIKRERLRAGEWGKLSPLFRLIATQMLFVEPPDHTRLRSLFNKAFTPRAIEAMRPRIQSIVQHLLDAVEASGRMDIIHDLAYPLPSMVIAEMLGIPDEDHHLIKEWARDFATFIGNPTMHVRAKEGLQNASSLIDYFRSLIIARRKHPMDDLLSALIIAEEHGQVLSEEELLANCLLLLFAGHETTTNLIGNGLLALIQNPHQLELLRNEPGLLSSAIEELLRYDSPTQWTGRVVKDEAVIGTKKMGQGQGVMLMIGSANRDPDQFLHPEILDITRSENRHIAFGHYRHFCIGATLARIEGQIAIDMVINRFTAFQIEAETLEWKGNSALRALKSFPISFDLCPPKR